VLRRRRLFFLTFQAGLLESSEYFEGSLTFSNRVRDLFEAVILGNSDRLCVLRVGLRSSNMAGTRRTSPGLLLMAQARACRIDFRNEGFVRLRRLFVSLGQPIGIQFDEWFPPGTRYLTMSRIKVVVGIDPRFQVLIAHNFLSIFLLSK